MKFLPYIVKIDPIGMDLAQMLDYSRAWFFRGQSPYIGANPYPPLAIVFFVPLLFVEAATAYHLMTLLTLVCYGLCVLVLPRLLLQHDARRVPGLLMLFFSGLFSYGLHFELERGQCNLLAFTCCLSAIYLFYHQRPLRVLAYFLFCLAVQLKIYPAIFVLLFVEDWRYWRESLGRIVGLAAGNAGLLFVLGPRIFQDFLQALGRESGSNLWIGNHTLRAFVLLAPLPYKLFFHILLFGVVAGCLGAMLYRSYRQGIRGFNAPLFLTCTLVALLIPPVSNDYTLVLLTAAMSVAFPYTNANAKTVTTNLWRRMSTVVYHGLLTGIAFAYASTLYSFTNKPQILRNNVPALLIMLCAWMLVTWRFSQRG